MIGMPEIKHKNIPIFIPHMGCPHDCVFCDQRTISGQIAFDESAVAGEIEAALNEEGKRILSSVPPRSYKIALCVEGTEYSSEALARRLDTILSANGSITLIIGSSFGLSKEVKEACDMKLSVSKLTFPHQMMRVLLLEVIYRAFGILRGTKYHK